MRFAALAVPAALLLAPLAAQAAQPPARFAVTLTGTVVDRVTYSRTVVDEECTSTRTGEGGRELASRSLRPTVIAVSRQGSRTVYRPARVGPLRVAAATLAGGFSELRRCRFLPPERVNGTCGRAVGTVRRMRAGFQRARNAIRFRRPGASRDLRPCGLDRAISGGWLNLVSGRIDEAALLTGRSLHVVARASGARESTNAVEPTLQVTQQTTVRWTLVLRRVA
jgi:hypothetical protein